MITKDGFFNGAHEAKIYHAAWLPEGEPKAVVLVVHGLGEHCGRYMNWVNHLVPQGYAIYGLDHIGHGRSGGTRMYVDRFSDFTVTLKMFFDMVQQWHPGKPVFLLGHSMGGLIASYYLLDHQDELAGAIISAPLVQIPDNVSGLTIFMAKVFSTLFPKLGLQAVVVKDLSRDNAVLIDYLNDPLVYTGKTTARLAAEMLGAMQQVNAEMHQITLPMLVLQGSEDKVINPPGTQIFFDGISSSDKTNKVYQGYYHETYNDIGKEHVLGDAAAWLDAHL